MLDLFTEPRLVWEESQGGVMGRLFFCLCIVLGWSSGGASSQISWRRLSYVCR